VKPIIDLTRSNGIMMINLTNKFEDKKEIIDLTIPEKLIIHLTEDAETRNKCDQDLSLSEEIMSKQCHFTAFNRSNMDDQNVVLPYDEFVAFLDTNFLCKKCKANNGIVYERQTYGIANFINMVCSCGSFGSIKARMQKNATHFPKWKDYTLMRLRKASELELNVKFLLGLQQCGAGINDAAVYAGMLNLAVGPLHAGWTKLEQDIGLQEIELGGSIIEENIELEKTITLGSKESIKVEGRVVLSVQGDTRWDRRGRPRL
jgi:hypothetical protein